MISRFLSPCHIRRGFKRLPSCSSFCQLAASNDEKKRTINILSFDGGGSKTFMAASILHHAMRLATIICNEPKSLSSLLKVQPEKFLEDEDNRKELADKIEKVENPIHPTDVYHMITGTSAGALIAFALVGGEDKRKPMSMANCLDKFEKHADKIFGGKLGRIPLLKTPFPLYKTDELKRFVKEIFKDSSLDDFRRDPTASVPAALTRLISDQTGDRPVLFDSRTVTYQHLRVWKVLLATMNAPFYFRTPINITKDAYVDGGIGGNCPLVQAIPRAEEIFEKEHVKSVLSVAPPAPIKERHSDKWWWFVRRYWTRYLVQYVTDGHAAYTEAKQRHKEVKFRRLSPRGESLKEYSLDDVRFEKMSESIKKEMEQNKMLLVDITAIATTVVHKYLEKSAISNTEKEKIVQVAAKLAYHVGRVYAAMQTKEEYGNAYDSYQESENLCKLLEGNDEKKEMEFRKEVQYYLAMCLKYQEKFGEAADLFEKYVESRKNDPYALFELAECLVQIGKFDEACTHYKNARDMQRERRNKNEEARIYSAWARACFFMKKENITCVEKLEEKALKIREDLNDNKNDIANSQDNLVGYFLLCNEYEKALKYLKKFSATNAEVFKRDIEKINDFHGCYRIKLFPYMRYLGKKVSDYYACYRNKFCPRIRCLGKLGDLSDGLFKETIPMVKTHLVPIPITNRTLLIGLGESFPDYFNLFITYAGIHAKIMNKMGDCFLDDGAYEEAKKKFESARRLSLCLPNDGRLSLSLQKQEIQAESDAGIALCMILNRQNLPYKFEQYQEIRKYADRAVVKAEKRFEDINHPLIAKTRYIRAKCYKSLAHDLPRFEDMNSIRRIVTALKYFIGKLGVKTGEQAKIDIAEKKVLCELASCFRKLPNSNSWSKPDSNPNSDSSKLESAINKLKKCLKECAKEDRREAEKVSKRSPNHDVNNYSWSKQLK